MRISDWSSDVCSSDLGLIFEGVSIDRIGAAISNYNTPSANIVWIGNYDVATPPRPMLEATDWLLRHGVERGWWRSSKVDGGPSSEERRVGKECVRACRSRWSPSHEQKKHIQHNTLT